MSLLMSRCPFRPCIALARKGNRLTGTAHITNTRYFALLSPKYSFPLLERNVDVGANISCMSVRCKSSKKKGEKRQQNKDEDSDEEDELDDFNDLGGIMKDKSLFRLKVPSVRIDAFLRATLGISRGKTEEAFYASKIRINGQKVQKKSVTVKLNDEVDLVKTLSPDNPNNLIVSRIELLSAKGNLEKEHIEIIVRRNKSLLIENYAGVNAYKSSDRTE